MTLTQAEMLSSDYNFDVTVTLTSGTTVRTISARQMLEAGSVRYWLGGNLVTAAIIEDRSTSRTWDFDFGDGSKALHPIFECWFYPQDKRVLVGVTVENCWASSTAANSFRSLTYEFAITAGHTSPVTPTCLHGLPTNETTQFVHICRSRWHKTFWMPPLGAPGSIRIDHNTDYVLNTGVLPRWDSSITPATGAGSAFQTMLTNWASYDKTVDGERSGSSCVRIGMIPPGINMPGSNTWIGMACTWDIYHILTWDADMRDVCLGQAELNGRIPWHYREADVSAGSGHYFRGTTGTFGRPVSVNARQTVTLAEITLDAGDDADQIHTIYDPVEPARDGWPMDHSHSPDWAFFAYFYTGWFYFLEELEMLGCFSVGNYNGAVTTEQYVQQQPRQGSWGLLKNSETRGWAWSLRTAGYAANLIPDGRPAQLYIADKIKNTIAYLEGRWNLTPSYPALSTIYNYANALAHPSPLGGLWRGTTEQADPPMDTAQITHAQAPWMEDWLVLVWGAVKQWGFLTDNLLKFAGKRHINNLLNGDSLKYLITTYGIPTYLVATGDWIQTWLKFSKLTADGGVWLTLPSNWGTDKDGEYNYGPWTSRAAVAQLVPFTIDGYSGLEAWNRLEAEIGAAAHTKFETSSPKWGFKPSNQHDTLTAIAAGTALDLGAYPLNTTPSGGISEQTITDYSGFVYDEDDQCMLMFGGGHSATYADYVARLDLRPGSSLAWAADYARTPRTACTLENVGTHGSWTSTGYPIARHSYDNLVYADGKLVLFSKVGGNGDHLEPGGNFYDYCFDERLWVYDVSAKTWSYSAVVTGTRSPTTQLWYSNNIATCYDPVSGLVLVIDPISTRKLWTYDPAADTLTERRTVNNAEMASSANMVYCPDDDKFYWFTQSPGADDDNPTGPIRVFVITPNRTTWASTTVDEVTGMSSTPWLGHETGWAWDAEHRRFLGGVYNGHIYAYHPSTKAWADKTMTPSSGNIGTLCFHALAFDAINGVCVFIADGTGGRRTWAYRYAS